MNEPDTAPKPLRTSRAEAKAERRQQLIEATIDSIARFGLTGTTMGRVTEIAGVSMGLANFHFDSKDQLFEAVLQHLAAEQRVLWQSRAQDQSLSSSALLLAIVDSQFHSTISARQKLSVWIAFYGDASARETYRSAVGNIDDERLDATVAIVSEMIVEAGYAHLDPMETALTIEALYDGLWLNMLLYPSEFRRDICRSQVLKVITALFPKHFDAAPALG
jgi:TetR/AcrR family transcriptional repressor of bet genes